MRLERVCVQAQRPSDTYNERREEERRLKRFERVCDERGFGLRCWGSGLRVLGLGFRVYDLASRLTGSGRTLSVHLRFEV